MASLNRSQALLLAAVLALVAAAPPLASARGGIPSPCGKIRKITVQNLCNHDLPLILTPEAGSSQFISPGFFLHPGTHMAFPVCSWSGQLAAAASTPVDLRLGDNGAAWYRADFTQLMPVHVTVTPHADNGRLEGQCPAVGCEGGHGRCARVIEAGKDCHNVDELKIIFFSA